MHTLIRRLTSIMIPTSLIVGYVGVMGATGRCAACEAVTSSVVSLAGFHQPASPTTAAPPAAPQTDDEPAFQRVTRPGSVDLDATYDLSDASIPIDEIHTLLPRDAIPALTDPKTQPGEDADWLPDQARVIVVTIGEGDEAETLGVPLVVLNRHEIVNTTLGGEPIAVTYCPLCDSATVFSRRIGSEDGSARTLAFGVSGALYNSNVLMYERTTMGLWSQLAMEAVSGPDAGRVLEMLPVRLMPFGSFKAAHPDARIVSNKTGHARSYDWSERPYQDFFAHDRTLVPVRAMGDAIAKKTLGVGIAFGRDAWFVPVGTIGQQGRTIDTPGGPVELRRTDAGVFVGAAPAGVRTVQAFYYAWSAFYPETAVVE